MKTHEEHLIGDTVLPENAKFKQERTNLPDIRPACYTMDLCGSKGGNIRDIVWWTWGKKKKTHQSVNIWKE